MKKWKWCMVVVLLAGIVAAGLYRSEDMMPADDYPAVTVEQITEEEYSDALYAYWQNPVVNGEEKEISWPWVENPSCYKITIADQGYSPRLPINEEVFFMTDEENRFMEEQCFIVTEKPDLHSEKLKYLNRVIAVDEYGGGENQWIIMLSVHTAYNKEGSYEFDYISSTVVDLAEPSVVRFTSRTI